MAALKFEAHAIADLDWRRSILRPQPDGEPEWEHQGYETTAWYLMALPLWIEANNFKMQIKELI